MDVHAIIQRLRWSYTKNAPELVALSGRLYPEFVFSPDPRPLAGEIPVFHFHEVHPDRMAQEARFLAENGYRTLDAADYTAAIRGDIPLPPRSILLAFDDGWRSLHTVAAPILREHGLRAVAFIIPGILASDRSKIPEGSDPSRFVTWDEARRDTDVIDFQSHSLWHQRVYVAPRLVDFIHPGFDRHPMNMHVPLQRTGGVDDFSRQAVLGTPIYAYAPRFAGHLRYFDDEGVREACQEAVARSGGESFFSRPGWRRELGAVFGGRHESGVARFETAAELSASILEEHRAARARIAAEIAGQEVTALCLPWFVGSDLAVELAREAGYTSCFWGVLRKRRSNRRGDNPFRSVRLPSEYLLRLPGRGRESLGHILGKLVAQNAPRLAGALRRAMAGTSST